MGRSTVFSRMGHEDKFPARSRMPMRLPAGSAMAPDDASSKPGGSPSSATAPAAIWPPCQHHGPEDGPRLAFRALIYGVTDSGARRPPIEFADGYLLTGRLLDCSWTTICRAGRCPRSGATSTASRRRPYRRRATYIVTAGYDPLRDEGKAYASALGGRGPRRLGVDGEIRESTMGRVIDAAETAISDVARCARPSKKPRFRG